MKLQFDSSLVTLETATPIDIIMTAVQICQLGLISPAAQTINRVIAGVPALSIWMRETLRYKYTLFPKFRVRAIKSPMGKIRIMYNLRVTVFSKTNSPLKRSNCVTTVELNNPIPESNMGYAKLFSLSKCLFSIIKQGAVVKNKATLTKTITKFFTSLDTQTP